MIARAFAAFALALAATIAPRPAAAQVGGSTSATNPTCPNANLFGGGMLASICWRCFFPMTLGGTPIGGTGFSDLPTGRAAPTCVCPGRIFGTPTPGITFGMWQPTHVVELVRRPYCSPALGGATLGNASLGSGLSALSNWGGPSTAGGKSSNEPNAYYNFHYWAFPVGVLLDMIQDTYCVSDSGVDVDLLYVSEIDPTWDNDELSLFLTPEAVLFANPIAQSACLGDAAKTVIGQPLQALFWCAGSWGSLYPNTGTVIQDSPPRDTSLAGARGLATLHRKGIAQKTMGNDAVCRNHPWATLPKTQYKLQTVYPIPELTSNHWLGASTFRWGEWRNIPAVGEDFVYLQWAFEDCCVNY